MNISGCQNKASDRFKQGGQFGADKGGQFAPEMGGQFGAEKGGQFERNFQYDIGMKTHPYTGYARSLFHQLTGQLIQLDIPEIEGIILPRSVKLAVDNKLVIISYPNPLREKYYIVEFKGAKDLGAVNIGIFDMLGKAIHVDELYIETDNIFQINTQGWPNAMYSVVVKTSSGELLYSSKFTKI